MALGKRLDTLGDLLRERCVETAARAGVRAQITGRGSLFQVHLVDRPLADSRRARWDARASAKMAVWYETMMTNGVICSPQGLGCLSTPMATAEVDGFARASEAALTAVREPFQRTDHASIGSFTPRP